MIELFHDYVNHLKNNQPGDIIKQTEQTIVVQSQIKHDTTYFSYEPTVTEQLHYIYPKLACFKEALTVDGFPFYENIRCILFHPDYHHLHVTFRMRNVRDYVEKLDPFVGLYKDNWVYLYQSISTQQEQAVSLQAIIETLPSLILESSTYRLLHVTGMIAQKGVPS